MPHGALLQFPIPFALFIMETGQAEALTEAVFSMDTSPDSIYNSFHVLPNPP